MDATGIQTGLVEFDIQNLETTYTAKATLAQCSSSEHSVTGSVIQSSMGYYPPVEINNYSRSLTSTMNYTRVVTAIESGYTSTLLTETDPHKISEAVEYYDGLGRPVQSISVAASPTGKDLIKPITYDEFGRQVFDLLPYSAENVSGSNGGFRNVDWGASGNEQEEFYQDHFDLGAANPYAYSESIFEESPLNRVLAQGAPGSAWQPSGTYGLAGNTIRYDYTTNISNDYVRLFTISNDTTCTSSGFYDDNELYMNIIYGEDYDDTFNDEAFSVEYKDKLGRVILKEANLDAEASPLRTYYIYDDFGLLRYVFPPEFSDSYKSSGSTLTYHPSTTVIKDYCYYYAYDGRKRMIEKQLPGAAVVYMVYDNRDRLVGTQDGNLRSSGYKWLMTKYDALNRPVITARVGFSSTLSQDSVQGLINAFYNNPSNEIFEEFSSSGIGYTDQSYPILSAASSSDVLNVIFYDNYDFLSLTQFNGLGFDNSNNIDVYIDTDGNSNGYLDCVRGQVTGTSSLILDGNDDTWVQSASFYDDKYRPIQIQSDLFPEGKGMTSTKYDFARKVLETLERQTVNSVITSVRYKNKYDHASRLLESKVYYNTTDSVLLAGNVYDELGQLTSKKLHSANSGNYLEAVDYEYNIRGWLASINNPDSLGNDKFGMNLYYDLEPTGLDNSARYNGNISAITWAHTGGGVVEGYVFDYDELNQLKEADYKTKSGSWSDPLSYATSYQYDLNGNITELTRNNHLGTVIDNLNYGYQGNRLDTITDSGTSDGFHDTNSGIDYEYDANGNMDCDKNKSIKINYNHLNLPEKIFEDIGTGDELLYIYDANGTKWMKQLTDGSTITKTMYAGGFVYEDNDDDAIDDFELNYILNPEGKIDKLTSSVEYQYNLKDHLGNTRVVFNGGDTIKQKIDYYPFGMIANQTTSIDNKYLYNGKELQDEQIGGVNLDWYSYGARFYDPALGRWHTQDLLSEWYYDWSPYGYVGNNPINCTDPDGLFITKAGAWLWRLFNGGEGDILKDKGGEYFVGRQVESDNSSDEATITYSRVFDRNGRSEGRDLSHEAAVKAFDTQHNWAMSLESMGVEYSYSSDISAARQSTIRFTADAAMPNVVKGGIKALNSAKAKQAAPTASDNIKQLANEISDWLGRGQRKIINKNGDVVLVSKDGTRRVRFDLNKPKPHKNPHTHAEELVNGKWEKSGPLYPKDVPHN